MTTIRARRAFPHSVTSQIAHLTHRRRALAGKLRRFVDLAEESFRYLDVSPAKLGSDEAAAHRARCERCLTALFGTPKVDDAAIELVASMRRASKFRADFERDMTVIVFASSARSNKKRRSGVARADKRTNVR